MTTPATPPKPLTNPPPEIIKRLASPTYAAFHDGVMWVRDSEGINGFPLDEWRIESVGSDGALHDGDLLLRFKWIGGDDE